MHRDYRPVSPLSLAQWEALENLANAAQNAVSAFSHALLMQATELSNGANADQVLVDALMAAAKRTDDARQSMLLGYDLHPQWEWLGGESFATREPHLMGMRRATVLTG